MNCAPIWSTILSALLTPVVAGFGLFIAYRQWRITQNKLKFDLFERRFKVYQASMALLAFISQRGKTTQEESFKFLIGTRETKWLLDPEIAHYFEKFVWEKAVRLETLDTLLHDIRVGDERTKNVAAQSALKLWFSEQYKAIDEKFAPYLKLSH